MGVGSRLGSSAGGTWSDELAEGLKEKSLTGRVSNSIIENPTREMIPRRSVRRFARIVPLDFLPLQTNWKKDQGHS